MLHHAALVPAVLKTVAKDLPSMATSFPPPSATSVFIHATKHFSNSSD